jgi:hypothetical protein
MAAWRPVPSFASGSTTVTRLSVNAIEAFDPSTLSMMFGQI